MIYLFPVSIKTVYAGHGFQCTEPIGPTRPTCKHSSCRQEMNSIQTWAQISNEMRFSFRPTSPARDEVRVVSLPVLPGRHSPLLNAPLRRSPARARLSFPEPSRSLVLLLLTSAAPVAGYPLRRRRRCDLSTRSLPWFARFGSDQAGSLVCGDSRRSAFSRPFGGLIWDWGVDADLPSGIH